MELLKTGSCSVVLGSFYYKQFYPIKKNKLLKITSIIDTHDEFKNLDSIRSIKNYKAYYCIPDEEVHILDPPNIFYKHVQLLVKDMDIFGGSLLCCYIDFAGTKDLLDTMDDLVSGDYSLWSSYKVILKLAKHILSGLSFLHKKQLCHLDIKPENIMVGHNGFQIIDFGLSSVEPFVDYIKNPKGTPGYFPKVIENTITKWLPKIEANDMIIINSVVPMNHNYMMVYRIDSYCFGRVLNGLRYFYNQEKTCSCLSSEKKERKILDRIINSLCEKDVYKRISATECLERYMT